MSTVPTLDKTKIADIARFEVTEVERRHTDLVDRLRAVSELANSKHDEANRLRTLRDQLALSFALYGNVRTLQNTLGVTRTRFYEMRCDALGLTPAERKARWLEGPEGEDTATRRARIAARAKKAGVKHYPTANINRLADVAAQVAEADAIAALARDCRDTMVLELIGQGWKHSDIAAVIGRDVSRVVRIKAKAPAA